MEKRLAKITHIYEKTKRKKKTSDPRDINGKRQTTTSSDTNGGRTRRYDEREDNGTVRK